MSNIESLIKELTSGMVAVLGIPSDQNSSFKRGASHAPSFIRKALHSPSTNLCIESGLDLGTEPHWREVGDLDLHSDRKLALKEIQRSITQLLTRDVKVVSLGGDHSITFPIIRAYAKKYPELNILHIDAHPDLYEELDGNRFSHACPFARIMEKGLAKRLVQVGIRTMTPHQREQVERFNVEVIEMRTWHSGMHFDFEGPVYLSFDIDALDPAFAPGTSHLEPGGFTTRDVLNIIQNLKAEVVGADIVEFNPERDVEGITAMAAAKTLKEIIARMLE